MAVLFFSVVESGDNLVNRIYCKAKTLVRFSEGLKQSRQLLDEVLLENWGAGGTISGIAKDGTGPGKQE